MYGYRGIRKIFLTALTALIGLVLGISLTSYSVSAAKMSNKPKSIHTFVTYNKMFVGQEIKLKVAPRKASIKVRFLPENKENKNMGVSVSSSNSRIIRVNRVNKFYYKLKAVRPGNVTITIKSLGKGYYGKRLEAKVRLKVEDRMPLSSIYASRADFNQIKLSFDRIIKDKFDRSKLKISLYDRENEKFLRDIPLSGFDYEKDSLYDVLLKLPSELESNSIYHIEYDGMYTELSVDKIFVSRLELVNDKIPKNLSTKLEFKAFDEKGNELTNTGYFKPKLLKIKLTDDSSSKVSLSGDSRILMLESGSKAVLEVGYQTVKQTFTVVCDDNIDSSLYNVFKSSIVYNGYRVNWDEVKENETPVLEKGKTDGFVAVLLKTKDGKYISNRIDDKYFEPTASFDYSVRKGMKLKVDGKTGAVTASKEGRYSVIVKMTYLGNTYQYSVPIRLEETKAGLLTVQPSDISVSNRDGKKEVTLIFRDSKGKIVEERDISQKLFIRYSNADADPAGQNSEPVDMTGLVQQNSGSKLKLDINATGKPAGTYYYELLIGDPKKNFAKAYLTVRIQDSTSDMTAWDYKFKDILEHPKFDMTLRSQDSLNDIRDRARGISLGLYSYNQFGTAIGLSSPIRYQINGKNLDPVTMPYIKYDGGVPYFIPYEIKTDPSGVEILTKLAKPGVYQVSAEVYNTRLNRNQTYSALINIEDYTEMLQEDVDFKVRRTGENGAPTVLQPGMSASTSDLASQIVIKMDGSRFVPSVTATGFDLRYPDVPVYYMSYGNNYLIDKVSIPVSFVTRDGKELFIYMEQVLNINLSK